MSLKKIIISGGGTGGHIFPAIAIADEIKKRFPSAEFLFIGAQGKMEMDKVPAAGYKIVGLKIVGFQRKFTLANFLLPFKILGSLINARKIIKDFKPDLVIGVGGYASGPTLKMATWLKIPTMIQEQNSFPGKTNKLLATKVSAICTAYEGLEKFFPKEKIVLTGNPVRQEMVNLQNKEVEAEKYFGFTSKKPTILVIGGSLGARTLNNAILEGYDFLASKEIQVIWQCGKFYFDDLNDKLRDKGNEKIQLLKFIDRMDLAYAMADVIISRAGAISVSELCIVGKPIILVPSPNVAEDHQTKNALALVDKNAAILVTDKEAPQVLISKTIELLDDKGKQALLKMEIQKLGKPDATAHIVNVAENLMENESIS